MAIPAGDKVKTPRVKKGDTPPTAQMQGDLDRAKGLAAIGAFGAAQFVLRLALAKLEVLKR